MRLPKIISDMKESKGINNKLFTLMAVLFKLYKNSSRSKDLQLRLAFHIQYFMNPYYLDLQQQTLPSYYYNSPYEQQQYLDRVSREPQGVEVATQTVTFDDGFEVNQGFSAAQGDEQLQQLLEVDLSIIDPGKGEFVPYGRICRPCMSIYLNNCQIQVVLAKLGRVKSSLLLVPYVENQLSTYIGVLYKPPTLPKLQARLISKPARGFISYITSTFKTKFDLFAFARLEGTFKIDYLAAVENILNSVRHLNGVRNRQIMIPFELKYGCAKELLKLVFGFIDRQKKCFFSKIVINCERPEQFQELSQHFTETVKVYCLKEDLKI